MDEKLDFWNSLKLFWSNLKAGNFEGIGHLFAMMWDFISGEPVDRDRMADYIDTIDPEKEPKAVETLYAIGKGQFANVAEAGASALGADWLNQPSTVEGKTNLAILSDGITSLDLSLMPKARFLKTATAVLSKQDVPAQMHAMVEALLPLFEDEKTGKKVVEVLQQLDLKGAPISAEMLEQLPQLMKAIAPVQQHLTPKDYEVLLSAYNSENSEIDQVKIVNWYAEKVWHQPDAKDAMQQLVGQLEGIPYELGLMMEYSGVVNATSHNYRYYADLARASGAVYDIDESDFLRQTLDLSGDGKVDYEDLEPLKAQMKEQGLSFDAFVESADLADQPQSVQYGAALVELRTARTGRE
jgi:hypothetical protein